MRKIKDYNLRFKFYITKQLNRLNIQIVILYLLKIWVIIYNTITKLIFIKSN